MQCKHITLFSRTGNVNQRRIGINLLAVILLDNNIKQKSESSTEAELVLEKYMMIASIICYGEVLILSMVCICKVG